MEPGRARHARAHLGRHSKHDDARRRLALYRHDVGRALSPRAPLAPLSPLSLSHTLAALSTPRSAAVFLVARGRRGSVFDDVEGIFYVNALGADGFYLHTYNINSGAETTVGPLPAAPGTAGPGGARVDNAIASLVVYPPPGVSCGSTGAVCLLEMRNSSSAPFLFMAWLDPYTGNSTQLDMPEDWYQSWEVDPEYFVTQWTGSKSVVEHASSRRALARCAALRVLRAAPRVARSRSSMAARTSSLSLPCRRRPCPAAAASGRTTPLISRRTLSSTMSAMGSRAIVARTTRLSRSRGSRPSTSTGCVSAMLL